jgi:hypothetical protein
VRDASFSVQKTKNYRKEPKPTHFSRQQEDELIERRVNDPHHSTLEERGKLLGTLTLLPDQTVSVP